MRRPFTRLPSMGADVIMVYYCHSRYAFNSSALASSGAIRPCIDRLACYRTSKALSRPRTWSPSFHHSTHGFQDVLRLSLKPSDHAKFFRLHHHPEEALSILLLLLSIILPSSIHITTTSFSSSERQFFFLCSFFFIRSCLIIVVVSFL